jgi:hypothetical protein
LWWILNLVAHEVGGVLMRFIGHMGGVIEEYNKGLGMFSRHTRFEV